MDVFIGTKDGRLISPDEALRQCLAEIENAGNRMDGQFRRFVYGIKNRSGALIKIGIATDPFQRLMALNHPGMVISWTVLGDPRLENRLHKLLFAYCEDREWFRMEGAVLALDQRLNGHLGHVVDFRPSCPTPPTIQVG